MNLIVCFHTATFGNAPEFLISSAALRSGYYRVVQLTLLGSVLTNLLFVFGLSCLVGGMQWQIQELRITSGNASIGMLLISTMGLVLPAALKIGNQNVIKTDDQADLNDLLSENDVAFSRFNSLVMTVGYICYLLFQLGSHKDEFEYDGDEYAVFGGGHNIVRTPSSKSKKKRSRTRRNMFCRRHCFVMNYCPKLPREKSYDMMKYGIDDNDIDEEPGSNIQFESDTSIDYGRRVEMSQAHVPNQRLRDSTLSPRLLGIQTYFEEDGEPRLTLKSKCSDIGDNGKLVNTLYTNSSETPHHSQICLLFSMIIDTIISPGPDVVLMSLRMGLVWLAIITITISIMSDVLVETIDGFAARSRISEVFTSVIIIPYFSNIAEQVSAIIFAYRNKMDLCIGVSVGSAIQIAQFVMPGCVLVGWFMNRPMTL